MIQGRSQVLSPIALQALQRNLMPPGSLSSEGDEITVLSKCLMTFFCCLKPTWAPAS